jgi:hypothetical protein
MTKFARLSLALAAVSLAACAGQPVISNSHVVEYYKPQELGYSAARGGMYTEVTGNPFQGEKAVLDRQVTEAFEDAHFGPRLAFFTEKPTDRTPAYRTVVLFNPALNANAERLCSSPDRPQAPRAAGEVRVMAALCSSESRLTSASGYVTGVKGPEDPAVGGLLRYLGLSLFPPAPGVRGADARGGVRPYLQGRRGLEREPLAEREVQQDPAPGQGRVEPIETGRDVPRDAAALPG